MGEAIQAITAADKGITAISSLLQQMKDIATAARSATGTAVTDLEDQFDALRTQVTQLASDSGCKGTNFLSGSTLQVNFNEAGTSSVTVTGPGDSYRVSARCRRRFHLYGRHRHRDHRSEFGDQHLPVACFDSFNEPVRHYNPSGLHVGNGRSSGDRCG